MRHAAGVLAARRHREAAPPMVVGRPREIADDVHDVVELAEHRRMCITAARGSRP